MSKESEISFYDAWSSAKAGGVFDFKLNGTVFKIYKPTKFQYLKFRIGYFLKLNKYKLKGLDEYK